MASRGQSVFYIIIAVIGIVILFSAANFLGSITQKNLMAIAYVPSVGLIVWIVVSVLNFIREGQKAEIIASERKLKKQEEKAAAQEADYYQKIQRLSKKLEKDPQNYQIQLEIANIYHFQAKSEQMAFKAYKKLLQMNPPEQTKNLVEKRLEQLKKLQPEDDGPVTYEIDETELSGALYYDKEGQEKAEREREEIQQDTSQFNPQTPQEYLEVAQDLLAQAKINMIDQAIEMDPNFLKAHHAMGKAHMEVKDYESAIRSFNRVIELDQNHISTYCLMGKAYAELEYYEDAKFCYQRVLKKNPQDAQALYHLGITFYRNNEIDEAVKIFQITTQADPHNYNAFYYLGLVMEQKGNQAGAIIAFNKALKLEPDNSNNVKIYNELGALFKATNKLEGAVQAYQNAIHFDPHYAMSYYNIAHFFEESGKKEEAITFYQKFTEFAKDDYPEEIEKVRLKIERGLASDATEMAERIKNQKDLSAKELFANAKKATGAEKIVLLKKAVMTDPNFFVANYELANCYREVGNDKKAVETYKEVLQKAPKFAMAYNAIGEIYVEHGKSDLAKKFFLKVLSINADHPKATANLKNLGVNVPAQKESPKKEN